MPKMFLQATRIGKYVQESLAETTTGKVVGGTSKGVFFLFGQRSLFLTRSQGLSPFNIVIDEKDPLPEPLQTGDEVFFSAGDLLIPERQVTIALADAEVWTPPTAQAVLNSVSERQKRIKTILQELQLSGNEKGFLFLAGDAQNDSPEESRIRMAANGFTSAYAARDLSACLDAAGNLFGLGGGLTPSGDDLLAGFILYQIRVNGQNKAERAFIEELGRELTRLAYQKTTFISANRLEAACLGWTETLFLDTIDFICDIGVGDEKLLTGELFKFGHSSGVDTVLGFALALNIF